MHLFGWITSIIAVLFAGSIHIFHDSINLYFMGFFRDLSRIKARKRRMKNNMAMVATDATNRHHDKLTSNDLRMLFFKQEDQDPLNDVAVHFDIDEDGQMKVRRKKNEDADANGDDDHDDVSNLSEYTREELYELGNGNNEEGVLLLSLYGRVYDVSEGFKYYGPGGKYHLFAGRDVTRALSTGCMTCLGPKVSSARRDHFELTPKTIAEGKKWVSFFETHDKYHLVGILKDGRSIDDLVDEQLDMQHDLSTKEEEQVF